MSNPAISLEMAHFNGTKELVDIIEPEKKIYTLYDYEYLRITKEKDIPHPEPTLTIDGAAIASPGNITGISAQIKSGKTAMNGVIMAAAISSTGQADGFPSIKCLPASGKAIIGIDSEQSAPDSQDNLIVTMRRAGLNVTPDNLRCYNIRPLSISEFIEATDNICALCSERFGGIHLITIDGGADYIYDTNDSKQSNEIIEYFTHLSIRYNCAVIIIVHLNPGTEKERGHFGSQLQRKCYGLLTIEKEKGKDISVLVPKAFRKAGNSDVLPIHFAYDKEKHYHVQIDAPDNDEIKSEATLRYHEKIAKEVFPGQTSLSYTEAYQSVMRTIKKGDRTAKTMIQNMVGWGFIIKGNDKNYRLNYDSAN